MSEQTAENTAGQFPCHQCGADLKFAPGETSLVCQYCGARNTIERKKVEITENNLKLQLSKLNDDALEVDKIIDKCDQCGAQVDHQAHTTASLCPYCGAAMVSTKQSIRQIKPAALLPFKIKVKEAKDAYLGWLKKLWFAPNALKKQARIEEKFSGMYVPYWTFDADTHSNYTGSRGDYYYVTRTRTVRDKEGNSRQETYQERRTRWTPVSGHVEVNFDDVLVVASRSVERKYADKLEPWDLQALVPYSDEYLAGFRAESYQIDLKNGYKIAQDVMNGEIRYSIERDIGGDEQIINTVNTDFGDPTYKHILLPVWICAYRFKGKVYQFLVNARTGEVHGERPWSWVKITLAAIAGLAALVGVLALIGEENTVRILNAIFNHQ